QYGTPLTLTLSDIGCLEIQGASLGTVQLNLTLLEVTRYKGCLEIADQEQQLTIAIIISSIKKLD
ncbi:hypothetical protein ACXL1A_005335, partial [Escherichia coli]